MCCLNEIVKQKYTSSKVDEWVIPSSEKQVLRTKIVQSIATNHLIGPIWYPHDHTGEHSKRSCSE